MTKVEVHPNTESRNTTVGKLKVGEMAFITDVTAKEYHGSLVIHTALGLLVLQGAAQFSGWRDTSYVGSWTVQLVEKNSDFHVILRP